MSKLEPLLCWSQKDDSTTETNPPATIACSRETSVDMFKGAIEPLSSSLKTLVMVTLECVEEPEWLLGLLQRFCQL
jgi:hypothetical protein